MHLKIYAIAEWDGDEAAMIARVSRLSDAQVDFVQLRAKALSGRALYELAMKCRQAVAAPTRLLINGRADVALAVRADGVHLPSDGIPVAAAQRLSVPIVGLSCHSVDDVRVAAAQKADYVLLGPVFSARSKALPAAISVSELAEAAASGVPVFALGGVSMENLEHLRGVPIAGVAAITMFMNDEPLDSILEAVRKL